MYRIAIFGYGNLGKGAESAVTAAADLELVGIFTRRDPETIHPASGAPVYSADHILTWKDSVDALIVCGSSAADLPEMTPYLAEHFNLVDSFDNHSRIPQHFRKVQEAAAKGGKLAVISGGWDPGMFSVNRLYAEAILPEGKTYTFWGRGVSQGHSDAIRHIPGVLDARQYTVPVKASVDAVLRGEMPELSVREKHLRECYVVAAEDADKEAIRRAIETMPGYFADYDTTVTFITMEEMKEKHAGLPHGGMVIRSGSSGLPGSARQTIRYELSLESNPEFTAGVLAALARAACRLSERGESGCRTIFDLSPCDLSPKSREDLIAQLL